MNIADKIDHTMLKPEATEDTIRRYCQEAIDYGFASVCVNSSHVPLVAELLSGTDVKTCCVVGFPLGNMLTASKAFDAKEAVKYGASEIDMVLHIGKLKEKDYDYVLSDIKAVADACRPALLKVIIETCLLTDEEKVKACELSLEAGADYVKTSTGFSTGGATAEDIRLMKQTVGTAAKVKASGGIRTHEQALALIEAGADRIGAGNGVVLL